MSAAIECDQKLGNTTLAISGPDNDITCKIYEILFDAEW